MMNFFGESLLLIGVVGSLSLGAHLGIEHLREYLRERRFRRQREASRRQFWGYD